MYYGIYILLRVTLSLCHHPELSDTVHLLFYTNDERIIKAIPNGDIVGRQQLEIRYAAAYEEGGIAIDPIQSTLYWIEKKGEDFVVKGGYLNGSGKTILSIFEERLSSQKIRIKVKVSRAFAVMLRQCVRPCVHPSVRPIVYSQHF